MPFGVIWREKCRLHDTHRPESLKKARDEITIDDLMTIIENFPKRKSLRSVDILSVYYKNVVRKRLCLSIHYWFCQTLCVDRSK